MKTTLILAFIFIAQVASAAPYYRFYRGVKLPQLAESQYLKDMAKNFVPMAPKLFPHLENYLVAIPSKEVGVDEIALLAYTNEEDYLRGRSTAEGKAYGDAHWDVFEREKSGSLVPGPLKGKIEVDQAYDLLQTKPNWSKGYTTFFIGQKKTSITSEVFLNKLDLHVKHVRSSFRKAGLKGYVIIVTADREYAFMNWASKAHATRALSQEPSIREEVRDLMDVLTWTENGNFTNKLERNKSYSVK